MASAKQQRGQTPLMRQYYKIKSQHPNQLLLFRMGDFYETFAEDALTASSVLGIVLSKRANGRASTVPLAGFPYHALDNHLPKLIQAGLRVAICEQLEDPRTTRTLVKRGVVEVVSPGVSLHDNLLSPKQVNYLAAVHWAQHRRRPDNVGVAYVDVSTGEFMVAEAGTEQLDDLLQSLSPSEVLVDKRQKNRLEAMRFQNYVITPQEDWVFTHDYSYEVLLRHFGTHSLKGFEVELLQDGLVAAGVVLHYLGEAQQGHLSHIKRIAARADAGHMRLDAQTKVNLSLLSSHREGRQDGPLITLLDQTHTAMGARLLRRWLGAPLCDIQAIQVRHNATEALFRDAQLLAAVQERLEGICDMERVVARICTARATPRDLAALRDSLERLPSIKELLEMQGSDTLQEIGNELDVCSDTFSIIKQAIVDKPPASVRDGNIFLDGYLDELDALRDIARSGKDYVAQMQQAEIERTGIPSLKVGYNKVFGYYLEVTHVHREKVPPHYIRKQTLVNAERYVTPELKEYEEKILTAEDKLIDLERSLFVELRTRVAEDASTLQQSAGMLAILDCYCSYASIARAHDYRRPVVDDSLRLFIKEGRHPVVEQLVDPFIPNTVNLDAERDQIHVITGPNMAGKSVVLRQSGLIVLLAQAGSFVPAAHAHIGLVDRIFTRVGASDNIVAGESTFLVEMNETASILNNATRRSLILLDEVGRGTSTFDGMSIAWSLVEHLHENARVAARTLFATHFHELNELAERFERVRNFRIQVQEHDGKVVFLRTLEPGSADHSYGIEVARMAGLPASVLDRARQILAKLEAQPIEVGTMRAPESTNEASAAAVQLSLFAMEEAHPVVERVRTLDCENMTPLQALITLAELKQLTMET